MTRREVARVAQTPGDVLVADVSKALDEGEEWDEREVAVLALARDQRNDLAMLQDLLKHQGPMVQGSQGQQRLNPLIAEIRLQRQSIIRTLQQLRLPDEEISSSRSVTKARAAHARWDRLVS